MPPDKHVVSFPIYLAPMAGYTDCTFRTLCKSYGADIVTTEMVSAKGLLYGTEATQALLLSNAKEQPLVVQLFGREPSILADAAKLCEELLGAALGAIDLNLGCPARKITRSGEGSALMREPLLVETIIRALTKQARIPITIKIRNGWDDAHQNAIEIARIAEDSGASLITLHARTREQYYSGNSDWGMIARIKAAVCIPVIGNGDVRSGADALRMRKETGCDGVAIGRAALGAPWIFSEIHASLMGKDYTPPTDAEKRRIALGHARAAMEKKGSRAIMELRKHMAWYIRGVSGAAALRARINGARSYAALAAILAD